VGGPTIRFEQEVLDIELKDIMVGDEAARARSMLQMSYPITNGIIKDWDDMNHVWDYTFREKLRIDPTERRILLTEAAMNPLENRRRMFEAMFETYGFAGAQVAVQAVLTLYAQGLTTGVVVDSGDGVTHIVPVFEGVVINNAIRRINIAGRDITKQLIKLLTHRGYAFNSSADFDVIREAKEALCYVALDPAVEQKLAIETTALVQSYTLPDGRVIQIGEERYQAPEILFNPALVDIEQPGVPMQVFSSIAACDIDLRAKLYENILLSGGSTMYPGLSSRLEKEVVDLYCQRVLRRPALGESKIRPHVVDPVRRKHFVFMGAAVFADLLKDTDQGWVLKSTYDEMGADRLFGDQKY
jgi:actin-related protein 2